MSHPQLQSTCTEQLFAEAVCTTRTHRMSSAPTVIAAPGIKKNVLEISQMCGIQITARGARGAHTKHCALEAFSMQSET